MLVNLLVLTIDESLGRLDYIMLSDQARLEIFFGDCIAEQKISLGILLKESDPSSYVDFCDWDDASCDEDGNVVRLHVWRCSPLDTDLHKFNFAYLPPKLRQLTMSDLYCMGDLSMSDLPEGLENFYVSGRCPCPQFETKNIPRSLTNFESNSCEFSGSCDLTVLPPNMKYFIVQKDNLTGTIGLNHLPVALEKLNLFQNKLNGPIIITNLPKSIRLINLSCNKFSGSCVITSIPLGLNILNLSNNDLSGTAVLLKEINGHLCSVNFKFNKLTALKDEKSRKHRFSKRVLKSQRAEDG